MVRCAKPIFMLISINREGRYDAMSRKLIIHQLLLPVSKRGIINMRCVT